MEKPQARENLKHGKISGMEKPKKHVDVSSVFFVSHSIDLPVWPTYELLQVLNFS